MTHFCSGDAEQPIDADLDMLIQKSHPLKGKKVAHLFIRIDSTAELKRFLLLEIHLSFLSSFLHLSVIFLSLPSEVFYLSEK